MANGTAVIICPGGAFHFLSIDMEGNNVAKWLSARGITAIVLKYRVARSHSDDPLGEMMTGLSDLRHQPSDTWIERFGDWLVFIGMSRPKS